MLRPCICRSLDICPVTIRSCIKTAKHVITQTVVASGLYSFLNPNVFLKYSSAAYTIYHHVKTILFCFVLLNVHQYRSRSKWLQQSA